MILESKKLQEQNLASRTFEELQTAKLKEVQNKYELQRQALITVPQGEEDTWAEQRKEYEAYQLDNTALTPSIDGLVAGDNLVGGTITKVELIAKIGVNISDLISGIATITGMQHGYERKINACTTQAELDAIVI